jgi:hypothetical protein
MSPWKKNPIGLTMTKQTTTTTMHYPYTSFAFPLWFSKTKTLKDLMQHPLPYLFLQYSQSLIARECGFSHTQKATQLMTHV